MSAHTRAAGGHSVRPAAGRQGPHRPRTPPRATRPGGGRPRARGQNRRGGVRGVLVPHPKEPEGGVRRSHLRRTPTFGQESQEGTQGSQYC